MAGGHDKFLLRLPKVELHVHIEGCLEPQLALEIAQRNGLQGKLPFSTVEEAAKAFQFENLQQFLDLRDATLSVMIEERDFYDVTMLYLERVAAQNVVHSEIFYDPQVHTRRGVAMSTFMEGFRRALEVGTTKFGITAKLIQCFMTELSPEDALATLEASLPWREQLVAVGLARGIPNWDGPRYPHSAFKAVMERARALGLRTTAHAGEEGPPSEIWEALNVLQVMRIDHGVHCVEDELLLQYLESSRIPLTVCPLSNFRLQIYRGSLLEKMAQLLSRKVCVTVNSDDPPFFGGYVLENLKFWADRLDLSRDKIEELVRNSVEASFLDDERKARIMEEVNAVKARADCCE